MEQKKAEMHIVKIRLSKETRRLFRLMAAARDLEMEEMIVAIVSEKAKALNVDDLSRRVAAAVDKGGDLSAVA